MAMVLIVVPAAISYIKVVEHFPDKNDLKRTGKIRCLSIEHQDEDMVRFLLNSGTNISNANPRVKRLYTWEKNNFLPSFEYV